MFGAAEGALEAGSLYPDGLPVGTLGHPHREAQILATIGAEGVRAYD